MFVVYKSSSEVIVTLKENEELLLEKYFISNIGRNLKDYTRLEYDNKAIIVSNKETWCW